MKRVSVFLVAAVSVLVFTLLGCSNGGTFTAKTYCSGDNPIESIVMRVTDREIEISASEDNQVYIEYFDGEKEYLDITVSESNVLTVTLAFHKKWSDFIGTKPSAEYRKIRLKIPNNQLANVTAATTNENITVASISLTENINLKANGGHIICERIDAGKAIQLTAKDGNITGTIIGGWDDFSISCKIKKGDCNLPLLKENGRKSLSADCNNGNISIEFVK